MIKNEHYADTLIRMAEKSSPKEAVHALGAYLNARGQGTMLRHLRAVLGRRLIQGRAATPTIEVANAHHAARAKHEAEAFIQGDLTVREDDTLIGGWRVVGNGTLVDNSFKKHLLNLYRRIIF